MAIRTTEARHPASDGLHRRSAEDILATLLSAQIDALAALRPALSALGAAAEAATACLASGGKLAFAGAGSSGLMALSDRLELAGTFGIPPARTPMLFAGGTGALAHLTGSVEDNPALAEADVEEAALGAEDLVLVLSASGTTPYALAVARAAQARGARVVGLANVAGSALLECADFPVLLDTGPEVISGSTRLGAATAQKVALNLLSTLVAVRLGHVHDGYMVNVVADNAKLVKRAARIVMALAGVGEAEAEAALEATHGAVKPAVLVARGLGPADAVAQLERGGGHLSAALDGER